MKRDSVFPQRAAVLIGMAALAPYSVMIAHAEPQPCSPEEPALTLFARPASVPLNVPTTVHFRLEGVGNRRVRSVRVLQGQGGQKNPVAMTEKSALKQRYFSGEAVVTATSLDVITAAAEVLQPLEPVIGLRDAGRDRSTTRPMAITVAYAPADVANERSKVDAPVRAGAVTTLSRTAPSAGQLISPSKTERQLNTGSRAAAAPPRCAHGSPSRAPGCHTQPHSCSSA